MHNYFKISQKFWKYLKIKFHPSLHWVVMNVVISSLYNFDVFISTWCFFTYFFVFQRWFSSFMMQFVISLFGIYVFDFLFIINPISVCHSITVFFLSVFFLFVLNMIDQLLCCLSFYLFSYVPFTLMCSIYTHTFHFFLYIQAEHDGEAIPVRNKRRFKKKWWRIRSTKS